MMSPTTGVIAAIAALALLGGCAQGSSAQLESLDQSAFAAPPLTISIAIRGYAPQAGKAFQNLFASNFSIVASQGQLLPSTARDAMPDSLKIALAGSYGFATSSPESAKPYFLDLLLYDLGANISQQPLVNCPSNQLASSSNDAIIYNDARFAGSPATFLGFRDCEKNSLGLNPSSFDTAGNGIPDYMKLRCGLNLTDANAAWVSTAGDGVQDIDKCKRNIPVAESARTQPNQLFAYQYSETVNADGTMDLFVGNIPIFDAGEDFLAFYVTETDQAGGAPALYTAFAQLKPGMNGTTLNIPYWATSPTNYFNQEIATP
jgi:hypothetical protein